MTNKDRTKSIDLLNKVIDRANILMDMLYESIDFCENYTDFEENFMGCTYVDFSNKMYKIEIKPM